MGSDEILKGSEIHKKPTTTPSETSSAKKLNEEALSLKNETQSGYGSRSLFTDAPARRKRRVEKDQNPPNRQETHQSKR